MGNRGDSEAGEYAGEAYLFTRTGAEAWSQQAKLVSSDNSAWDLFGSSVALSGDSVLVGSPFEVYAAPSDLDSNNRAGSAYIFDLACDATYSLPSSQWQQVSLPCDPGVNNTVNAVFGDDMPGSYGSDWFVYRYDANGYASLSASDTLSQGEVYGIFQWSGSDATIDMPDNSTPTPVTDPVGCLDTAKGCFEIPLVTQVNSAQSSLVGYPFAASGRLGDVRVQTDTGVCASGCDLDTAQSQGIVLNKLNGIGAGSSGNLESWKGYWATTLQNADGLNPRLLVPRP